MNDALALAGVDVPALPAAAIVPAIVAAYRDQAALALPRIFAVSIRNSNTRAAYARGVSLLRLVRGAEP